MTRQDPFGPVPPSRRPLVEAYVALLREANRSVNLVSRATEQDMLDRHVAHSLTLAMRRFGTGTTVVDWGTGGGLPAVPLAICFPDVHIVAVDSIAKKTRVLEGIVRELNLDNVTVWRGRAESWDGSAEWAVSRATARLDRLWSWTRRVLRPCEVDPEEWEGGLLCLKGGDLSKERQALCRTDPEARVETIGLQDRFGRAEWAEKYILHVTSVVSGDDRG